MVQIYAGLRDQELRTAAAQYVNEFVRPRLFDEMVSLVAALRVAGVELWTVSSTNKWVVAAGVSDFGIPEERVLAAEVRVDKGLITSDIVAIPTGKGKSTALAQAGLAHPDAVFGNSIHDLAMLEIARNPYPVNPSPALLEKAAKNGWGYFLPLLAEGTQAAVAGE
jgi:phosphoserine phosphatase